MIYEMGFRFFSRNGEILPVEQAIVPLSRVEYSYGFGVYESIRVAKGKIFFLEEHCQRLMASAEAIGLEHNFAPDTVCSYVEQLVLKNEADACNVKILLIGGASAQNATLDILCLKPLFPDRQLYKSGASCVTYKYERLFPQAKTLNMLSSYLAFRQAKSAGAYDALLVNRNSNVTEGTRTNFFGLKGTEVVSPPSSQILPGVARANVLKVAKDAGYKVTEQDIPLDSLGQLDSVFLTSTSSKILPISRIDGQTFSISPELNELMKTFGDFLSRY